MCGIFSAYSNSGPLLETKLRAALRAISHRGPDGSGLWLSSDGRIALGHTRLSIIDLPGGTQPIASEDGMVQIVVNGEFYDFERIRAELIACGHSFRSGSDSEIALHLYEEYGVQCLDYLRGEFAFVLWDQHNRTLFAARDRFGIKPLCYASTGDCLYLASEAKGLFAAGVRASWDQESFYHAASLQYAPANRTFFEGVSELKPGHYLLASAGEVQQCCYWDLDYPEIAADREEQSTVKSDAEFINILSDALRLRLRADLPVACELSGGVDSATVLALAAQHSSYPLHCFTVAFEDQTYDECDLAQEMCRKAGGVFHPLRVSQIELAQALPDAVYISEGLGANGHLAAKYLLSRAVRQAGFKVVLSGEGADELLAGYPHLRQDLWDSTSDYTPSDDRGFQQQNFVSSGLMLADGSPTLNLLGVKKCLGYLPNFLKAKAAYGLRMHSLFNRDFAERFAGKDCLTGFCDSFDYQSQLCRRHPVNQSLYLWTKSALAKYILRTLGDGTEMAHSVEARLPFLDHKLFEYARMLPVAFKLNGGIEKQILREGVKPLLTERIYARSKHPFVAPPLSANRTVADFIQDQLRSLQFKALPFFESGRVNRLLDTLPQADIGQQRLWEPVVMTLLSACFMQQRFGL